MRFLLTKILVLFISYEVSVAGPVGSFPLGGNQMELTIPSSPQIDAVRDWLKDMRSRILDPSQLMPDAGVLVDFTRKAYEQQKKFLEGLVLDMSKIVFDPEKDWGLRLGRWYVIKKEPDVFSGLWNILHPKISDSTTGKWPEIGFNSENNDHSLLDRKTADTAATIFEENPGNDVLNARSNETSN